MKVLTANRLSDGTVVYIGAAAPWVEDLALAKIAPDAATEALLTEAAAGAVKAREVVGAYLMPVAVEDGRILPQSVRERIRAAGPTNRLDLGKQAERPAAGR